MFADAIEAFANDKTPRVPINVTYLQGADEIVKFMEKRKRTVAFYRLFLPDKRKKVKGWKIMNGEGGDCPKTNKLMN